jgi:hypothetical protein
MKVVFAKWNEHAVARGYKSPEKKHGNERT